MKRVSIGDGRWFDADKAQKWEEGTRWNGNNHISLATGSQWEHERLYLTASGTWIIYSWSQWQGSGESYEVLSEADAAAWLINNNHELPDELADIGAKMEV